MNTTNKILIGIIALIAIIGIRLFAVDFEPTVTVEPGTVNIPANFGGSIATEITFFSATTTTATSTNANVNANIEKAERATFFFSRGDTTGTGNSGSSLFSVEVSQDNSTWIAYNKLIQNLATSTTPTTVSSVSLSGTTTIMVSLDLENDLVRYVRCVVNETTDGEHTCKANIEY